MSSVEMICRCGTQYFARQADLDRGWGLSCDKACAAKRRDFGGKAAKRVDGLPIKRPKKKGANRIAPDDRLISREADSDRMHQQALYDSEAGWDAHKSY